MSEPEADLLPETGAGDTPQALPGAACSSSETAPEEVFPTDPHWRPFLSVFPPDLTVQFVWAVTTDTIETYEHRETLRFVHIDSVTLECFSQSCDVISSDSALQYALQPRVKPVADFIEKIPEPQTADPVDAILITNSAETTAFEPELNSYLRTVHQTTTSQQESTIAAEPARQPILSRLGDTLALGTLNLRSSFLRWSDPRPDRAQEPGDIQALKSHEPSFATFTRRTSTL